MPKAKEKKIKIKTEKTEKKLRTYVAIILDRSGSMCSELNATIEGYNEQVQQIKQNAEKSEVFVSLVTFNGEVFEHLWNQPASELQETTTESYEPGGSTAMFDAMGYTIDKLNKTTDPTDENNAYLIITITDGRNNSSTHFDWQHIKSKQEDGKNTGRWTFVLMGCKESEVDKVAGQLGIAHANRGLWSNRNSKHAKRAMRGTAKATAKYLQLRDSNPIIDLSNKFLSEGADSERAMDYTDDTLTSNVILDENSFAGSVVCSSGPKVDTFSMATAVSAEWDKYCPDASLSKEAGKPLYGTGRSSVPSGKFGPKNRK